MYIAPCLPDKQQVYTRKVAPRHEEKNFSLTLGSKICAIGEFLCSKSLFTVWYCGITTAQQQNWSDLDCDIFLIRLANFQWATFLIAPKTSVESINQEASWIVITRTEGQKKQATTPSCTEHLED